MTGARFNYAEEVALSLLFKHMFLKLTINPADIIHKTDNIDLITYTWMARKRSIAVDELSDILNSSNGCCIFNRDSGQYSILYNDTLSSPGRVRWTIAHELGHCVLQHLLECKESRLTENSISYEKYRILEQEADAFARELLAPTALVMYLGLIMPNFCPRILAECFGVSKEAAENITSHTHYLVRNDKTPAGKELLPLFKPFLDKLPARYPTQQELEQKREIEKALRLQGKSNRYIYTVLKQYGF